MSTVHHLGQQAARRGEHLRLPNRLSPLYRLKTSIICMAAHERGGRSRKGRGAQTTSVPKNCNIGRRHHIPYALDRLYGFICAELVERNRPSQVDFPFLWEALKNVFEHATLFRRAG